MNTQFQITLENDIVLSGELFNEEAPFTVQNFINLVNKGFYNGLIFHKAIPNAYIQTGCPNGDGTGNAGYFIKCELSGEYLQRHDVGVLSMAHCGRNTGSSQFFICIDRRNVYEFDGNHTCFGRVMKGVQFLDDIKIGDTILNIRVF
jgi:peptidyl-prolyl cis-trans isomerase B (cyclophilin B)